MDWTEGLEGLNFFFFFGYGCKEYIDNISNQQIKPKEKKLLTQSGVAYLGLMGWLCK